MRKNPLGIPRRAATDLVAFHAATFPWQRRRSHEKEKKKKKNQPWFILHRLKLTHVVQRDEFGNRCGVGEGKEAHEGSGCKDLNPENM